MDVLKALSEIKHSGYEGVELTLNDSHLHPLKTKRDRIKEIKDYAADNGIDIVCVAAGGADLMGEIPYEPSMINQDKVQREKRLDVIKKSIEISNYLEAPVLNINSGMLRPGTSHEQAEEYFYSGVTELLKELGKLILVIEPEPGFLIGTTKSAIDAIKTIESPQLRLNLDIGHVFCSETDCYNAIEKALPYARHIHIEDIKNGIHHHEIPGEGDIDFKKIILLLKESGYSHYVSVELHHHDQMWQRALNESLEYLQKLV
jgi:sugar phosphate isomerase/epimerase